VEHRDERRPVEPGGRRLDPERQGWLLARVLELADALPQCHADDIGAPPFRELIRR